MAGSLTLSLQTALSGLTVNQGAMDAVAENIANVNSAGYTRKEVTMEQRVVAGVGSGVQLGELKRQIDEGLLKSLRLEISKYNSLNVQTDYFDRMQFMFGTPDENNAISHIITEFAGALESMSLSPDNTLEQSEVLRWANELVLEFQDMSKTIQELRLQADGEISTMVDEINSLALQIRDFNDLLVKAKSTNQDVNDLMDQRDQAINQLSEIIDIRYFYRSDGDVVVFTSAGRTLVDNIPATLTHDAVSASDATSTHSEGDIGGIYVGEKIASNDITNDITSGKMYGLISLRDTVLADLQSSIDELAGEMRDMTNQIHNSGVAFPGAQSMTGTRAITNSSAQLMKMDVTTNAYAGVTFTAATNTITFAAGTDLSYLSNTDTITISGTATSDGTYTMTNVNDTTKVITVGGGGIAVDELGGTTMTLDRHGGDDVVIAVFDASGDQQAATTLNTIMQSAAFAGTAYSDRGAGSDWTIDRVASEMQAWLRHANGANLATATVTVNSAGKFQVDLNSTSSYLGFRDQAGTASGAALEDVAIQYSAAGIDYTNVAFDAAADTITFGTVTSLPYLAVGSTFTINGATTAANNGVYTVDAIISNVVTVSSVAATENNSVALTLGATTDAVSGFSNFLGLNDFFTDSLSDNIWETNVVTSSFSGTAAQLTFTDDDGLMGSVAITATQGLTSIRDSINNANINVNATVVSDGSGLRLRVTHANGKSMVVSEAVGNSLMSTLGMHVADTRAASAIVVRSDLPAAPSKLVRGAVQWDATLGAAGEFYTSIGDETVIEALAKKFTENNVYDSAGGIANITVNMSEYAAAVMERNASLAYDNKQDLRFQSSLSESLQYKSDSIRGVNLDEELSNLLIYEQAYSAAARVINIIQSMFDALERAIG